MFINIIIINYIYNNNNNNNNFPSSFEEGEKPIFDMPVLCKVAYQIREWTKSHILSFRSCRFKEKVTLKLRIYILLKGLETCSNFHFLINIKRC